MITIFWHIWFPLESCVFYSMLLERFFFQEGIHRPRQTATGFKVWKRLRKPKEHGYNPFSQTGRLRHGNPNLPKVKGHVRSRSRTGTQVIWLQMYGLHPDLIAASLGLCVRSSVRFRRPHVLPTSKVDLRPRFTKQPGGFSEIFPALLYQPVCSGLCLPF